MGYTRGIGASRRGALAAAVVCLAGAAPVRAQTIPSAAETSPAPTPAAQAPLWTPSPFPSAAPTDLLPQGGCVPLQPYTSVSAAPPPAFSDAPAGPIQLAAAVQPAPTAPPAPGGPGAANYPQTTGYQQAPGDEEDDALRLVESYNFLVEHYDEPGVGPRPYPDYAPEGYYPVDYEQTPGAGLYVRLRQPAEITREDLSRMVVRGPLAGSFVVPGSGTAFRFSGFARMGATFDFAPVGSPDQFITRNIPVPQTVGQNVNYSARPTRLGLDTWTPVPDHDLTVHTFIQFDYLSGNPPAVGSSANPRLRFAFVDVGWLRVGQDTTVFMDPGAFPRLADSRGPNGIVNVRQGLVRLTLPLTERLYWAAAAEHPFSDVTTGGQGTGVQDVPDFTSHLRLEGDVYHVQASTIVRTLGYRPTDGLVTRRAGWGVNLTSSLHPWAILHGTDPVRDPCPSGWDRSRLLLQCGFGTGIGRYIQDTSGIGLDAAVDANGAFRPIDVVGWTMSYEHWYSASWLTTITRSRVEIDPGFALPGNTFERSDYLAVGLWWIPIPRLSLGMEYLSGRRLNIDGQSGRADRIQTVCQYNF